MANEIAYYTNTDTDSRALIRKIDHPDAQWFPKAGFGLFMHWGISSVDGSFDLSWGSHKNFQYCSRTCTPEEYFALATQFNPDKWDPNKILKAAREAGMHYAVLTTRHLDGYALWPSEYGNFNTRIYMNGRDLVGEFVDACRNNGIKVGFYYSPGEIYTQRNYYHFGGWKQPKECPEPMINYMNAIGRAQIYELLTRYGKVDVLWFDGEWTDLITEEEIRELQPGIVFGRGPGTNFDSLECCLPNDRLYETKLKDIWWECCHELNSCWGYTEIDQWNLKSLDTLIHWVNTVRKYNGNLLLNIGPDSHGELPKLAYERLKQIGDYIKAHPGLMPEWDED